ncbi:DNA primase [Geobacter pelophilus]|uniref:DNA primase n=1 Tax=Geoanaerobacter pelophilus TaxID=60036 RepID=A0AAW4L9H3_9BACT|nr:DNA primase [Geoanaerobacter pelophilus]MBT0663821.1 DNA primase [Geoanaerobacter pelophilus]
MIPEETVREIRERVTILDVVSDYVSLKKAGANYQGLCPFHGEKTPSFNVNPGRGIFHCFGCGAGGNAFSFIMRIEGISFPEAVKHLAKKAGVAIDERPLSRAEQTRKDEKEEFFRIAEIASGFYHEILVSGESGESCRSYLKQRGVDPATVEAYRLGFAPEKWDSLCRYLERRKIDLAKAEKLGLVRQRESGGYYDTFRNRLLFTISDLHGRPVAFGGRVLDDSLPKYINSPESPIYHKGDILFGLDLAKQAIREKKVAIVVEGYFDHLSMYQAGIREVVATCGTALTSDQVKLLHRYAGQLYILFDSDGAGQKATVRAMDMLLPEGIPASVIELPAGDDPDSFVKREGAEGLLTRMQKSRSVLDYFFRLLLNSRQAGTIEGKRQILDELLPRLRLLEDRMQRKLYVTEIARVLGVDEAELKLMAGVSGTERQLRPTPQKARQNCGTSPAEMLLLLMGTFPELAQLGDERKVVRLLPHHFQAIADRLITESKQQGSVDLGHLFERSDSHESVQQLASLFVNDAQLQGIDPQKAFDQCCASLERSPLKDLKELARELARTEQDSERYLELLKEIETLRNKKSQLL